MLIIDTVSACFGHLYAHLQEKDRVLLHVECTLNVAPQYRNLPHPTLPANTLHMQ